MDNEPHWRKVLKSARLNLKLSQAQLARLAAVSAETVRGYEAGRRTPTRDTLEAIITPLSLDRLEANQVRYQLGFASQYLPIVTMGPGFMFTIPELREWIEETPWPQFVLDENVEVVVANSVVQKVWGVDFHQEFLTLQQRNLTSVATNPRFADRAVNWEEMVAYNVAVWKGHHLGPESLDQPSPYFNAVLTELAKGDPAYVGRFLDVWQRTAPKTPKVRDRYPVIWRDPDHGEMRFLALSSTANEWEGLFFHDWIPTDAPTWEALDRLIDRKPPRSIDRRT